MIFAAQKIAREDPDLAENIGLLLVVSEELDHIGMVVCLIHNISSKSMDYSLLPKEI